MDPQNIQVGKPALIEVRKPHGSYYVARIEAADDAGLTLANAGIAKVGTTTVRKAPDPVSVGWDDVVLVLQEEAR
jgi:hypothetical protein